MPVRYSRTVVQRASLMRRLYGSVMLPVVLAGASATLLGFAQQPTFRTETTSVLVDVVATNAAGQPVSNLVRDDFLVTEDGEPRTLTTVDRVDLPFHVHVQGDVTVPDEHVVSNTDDGRVYVVIIDNFHMTPAGAHYTRGAIEQFIRQYVQPHDMVAIARIGIASKGFEFTDDRARQLRLVDALTAGVAGGVSGQIDRFPGAPQTGPMVMADTMAADDSDVRMLRALSDVAEYVPNRFGRRTAILLFSEGVDTNRYTVGNSAETRRMFDAETALIAAASRSHVNIYTIDPRGGSAIDPFTNGQSGWSQWESLRALADGTGGRAILGRTDFASAFEQVVRDNSTYYVLGYVSPHADDHDGKFHSLRVRVNRPGVVISARKGWAAQGSHATKLARTIARQTHSTDLASALLRPLPVGNVGLSLRAMSSSVQVANGTARYAVVVEGKLSELSASGEGADSSPFQVDIGYRAISDAGQVLGMTAQHVQFPVHDPGQTSGAWRWEAELTFPVEHVQLRLAARSRSGAVGAVYLDLDAGMPRRGLDMGEIALSSTRTLVPTAGMLPSLAPVLPGPPTTARTFSRDDTVVAFVRLTDSDSEPHSIALTTTIRSSEGAVVLQSNTSRDAHALAAPTPAYVVVLPLNSFHPGPYTLSVQGSTPSTTGLSRSISFSVQ